MRYFIVGPVAIFLIGCSALFKSDKPVVAPVEVTSIQEPQIEAPLHIDPPRETVRRISAPTKPPLEIKVEDATPPCRNIDDEDIYQEIRKKLSCIEENVK